jgi:hypothetical protein
MFRDLVIGQWASLCSGETQSHYNTLALRHQHRKSPLDLFHVVLNVRYGGDCILHAVENFGDSFHLVEI